jgi:serine/threonine protein kinase
VLVRTDGTPVLLDFGSARQEMLRMAVGQVSDGYSPPEFYGTSDKVGPWSDVYGLGATFYKLITDLKVPIATDRLISDCYIPIANSIKDGYSSKFFELIDSSLRLSTAERPQSISALKSLLAERENFSNRLNDANDLRGEVAKVSYSYSPRFRFKNSLTVLGIFILILGVIYLQNRSPMEVSTVEKPKVLPILIEEQNAVAEAPSSTSKSADLQQALYYLARVSTSPKISWYSIPETDLAIRSFRFATSEIDKRFDLAFDRKAYIYSESSKEYVFKDFSLSDIRSLEFVATDTKCDNQPTGPVAGSCNKSGRDFKCRLSSLSVKYERICLSAFFLE